MNQHRARPLAAAAVAVLALSLTGCGSSGSEGKSSPAAGKDGVIVDTALLAFDPKVVTVKKGQTVSWVGGDDITHVLVEGTYEVGADGLRTKQTDDKAFHLDLSKKGQRVSHTYDTAGTFTYYCTIHRGMNGTVTVS